MPGGFVTIGTEIFSVIPEYYRKVMESIKKRKRIKKLYEKVLLKTSNPYASQAKLIKQGDAE
ncbi:MAG TPA: hypothetical protein VEB86_18210 [Chryseosolibacter sp.]|nr:hypothetical protein [Chryseosolibacter sp.]